MTRTLGIQSFIQVFATEFQGFFPYLSCRLDAGKWDRAAMPRLDEA